MHRFPLSRISNPTHQHQLQRQPNTWVRTYLRVFYQNSHLDCVVYVSGVLSSAIDPAIPDGNPHEAGAE